ncbi:rRNA adenine N-6-methyltransferase family protein [uncultured Clostridium sp.]|uniref:class I SAM-dependent methyltransferase n=1 Tax=uncultured Clostridium sp. TaxID=59620 RepID=UPI00260970DD|nr:rRNA adenine N-6-methyltransferase family protein [uncultured Clostridium sp.]
MFVLEYIKNPRTVGAIAPSSKYLAEKMISDINFKDAKCIIEYGPGTGIFTEKILSRVKENTTVILIEINKEFYNILKDKYGHKNNVIILNESAENIDKILKEYSIEKVDYILSGLPFTSLPSDVSRKILTKTAKILEDEAGFITFQYSLLKLGFFKKYFSKLKYKRVIRNLPPAYVLECRGEKDEEKYISCR